MILLIDNYDSFVHNLARYFCRLGQQTVVIRNDEVAAHEVLLRWQPQAIVLSPGPCTPHEAGCSLDLVRASVGKVPMLGVCLGHQTIAAALGGKIVRAPQPMHGRASTIEHGGEGIFTGVPSPLVVGRYHSLIVEEPSLPNELEITATADDGTIMALAHRRWPIFGVQFHPESILTSHGYSILGNFLELAGIRVERKAPGMEDECPPIPSATALPAGPVTF